MTEYTMSSDLNSYPNPYRKLRVAAYDEPTSCAETPPYKPIEDVAVELRDRMRVAHEVICDVLNEADTQGIAMTAQWQRGPNGRFHPQFIKIGVVKTFFTE